MADCALAGRVVALVHGVLGERDVLGAYLHGSAVAGGLRPASDVDVLAVVRRRTGEEQRRALVRELLAVSGAVNAQRPVELVLVVADEVRPWRYPPVCDLLYGEWLRGEFEAGAVPQPEPMPDLAVLLTAVRSGGIALAGPPPRDLLDPVPHADLVRACLAGVPGLVADLADDTRNVVLTFARIWCTLVTGEIRSKDAAADWALPRLPAEHRPVLAHARDLYLTTPYTAEHWPPALAAATRPHAAHVLTEIHRAAAAASPGR